MKKPMPLCLIGLVLLLPFGQGINDDPRALLNPLTYRGYMYDEDIDMYYLKSRFYDANVGRFLNADVLFDTGTGVLGTNMFAYCLNNPVNRVDRNGMWSYDVHIGKDGNLAQAIVLQGPDSVYNGIKYGTLQWTEDMNIKYDYAIGIALGDWLVEDFFARIIPTLLSLIPILDLGEFLALSWHGNTNLFQLVPDSRDLHMLETLIEMEIECKYFDNGNLILGLTNLGRAVHPAQDKDGHADFWQIEFSSTLELLYKGFTLGFFDGDDVSAYFDQDEVRYYQTENLVRTRDATFDVLGRFLHKYSYLRKGC